VKALTKVHFVLSAIAFHIKNVILSTRLQSYKTAKIVFNAYNYIFTLYWIQYHLLTGMWLIANYCSSRQQLFSGATQRAIVGVEGNNTMQFAVIMSIPWTTYLQREVQKRKYAQV